MKCAPHFCLILTQSGDSQQILRTVSSVKCYENMSSGSALILADRRKESRDEANRRFFDVNSKELIKTFHICRFQEQELSYRFHESKLEGVQCTETLQQSLLLPLKLHDHPLSEIRCMLGQNQIRLSEYIYIYIYIYIYVCVCVSVYTHTHI